MSRMLPGTRALRTFEAAGRHLNFTRAATELGLTPAAVSYQIKDLEDQLGFQLFVRTSRRIQLTPAGAVLFAGTAEALDTLQHAASRARKIARGTGQLRVSLGARFASNWLLPRLARFRTAYPDIELTFDITDEVRDFANDDVDIAIRFGSGDYPNTRSERLFGTVVVPVCSPELLTVGPALNEPRDLLHHTLCHVDCQVDGMIWPNWSMWMAAAGVAPFDDRQCLAFSDSSHVVQAVLEGSAVGLAEPAMIANELTQGRLVRLFDIGLNVAPQFAYHLVYAEGSKDDSRVSAFRQWLLAEVA